jgi:hypothetical protein
MVPAQKSFAAANLVDLNIYNGLVGQFELAPQVQIQTGAFNTESDRR